jgi:hypothetical protein
MTAPEVRAPEMTAVNKSILKAMYEASEQDLAYGIGLIGVEGAALAVPMIQCFYRGWCQEMLRVVTETLRGGVELSLKPDQVYLATRERIEGREYDGRDTSILRAPAWDACLEDPDPEAVQLFDANSDALAHFVLILQTPEWECVTIVRKPTGVTRVGPVQSPTLPAPPNA